MSPTSYQAAPPRGRGRTLPEGGGQVKSAGGGLLPCRNTPISASSAPARRRGASSTEVGMKLLGACLVALLLRRVVGRRAVAQAGPVEGAHRRRSGPQVSETRGRRASQGHQPRFHEQRFHLRGRGQRPGRRRDVLPLGRDDLQPSRHRPGRRHRIPRPGREQLRRAARHLHLPGEHADHPEGSRRIPRQERSRDRSRPGHGRQWRSGSGRPDRRVLPNLDGPAGSRRHGLARIPLGLAAGLVRIASRPLRSDSATTPASGRTSGS